MIIALSTSSPLASVALISEDGALLASQEKFAPLAASEACILLLKEMLESQNIGIDQATGFVADLGPGSFTGIKVAVTLAKVMGFAQDVKVSGISSFDLISQQDIIAIPSTKGKYTVRQINKEVLYDQTSLPEGTIGYGALFSGPTYPRASAFSFLINQLKWTEPDLLLPEYLMNPNISTPKKPFH